MYTFRVRKSIVLSMSAFSVVAVAMALAIRMQTLSATADQDAKTDATIAELTRDFQSKGSVREKIAMMEPRVIRLRGSAGEDQRERLAGLYETLGQEQMASQSLASAEPAFIRANALSPKNPRFMTDLATLYEDAAPTQSSAEDRANYFQRAISWWNKAASTASDEGQRNHFLERAGSVYFAEALELVNSSDLDGAKQTVRDALAVVPEKTKIYQQLADLYRRITEDPR